MIFITINSKGGVGKSTLANQILPTYLYLKNGQKAKLFEIDDENKDSLILSSSEILNATIISSTNIKKIDEIFIDDEDVILDIGGNITATIFLDEMKKIGEFSDIIWFIPVGQGLQDTANGLDTYHKIKDLDNAAKIIFVLSNQKTDDLEWEYLHFFGNAYLDTQFAIPNHIEDFNYIVVPSSDIVNNAKTFNKTIYDISQNKSNFRELAKEAKLNNDDKLKRKYLFLNRVKNEAIEYILDLKSNLFIELGTLLKQG
jgi:hypothetical protein